MKTTWGQKDDLGVRDEKSFMKRRDKMESKTLGQSTLLHGGSVVQ
jgi:hypothetical protein